MVWILLTRREWVCVREKIEGEGGREDVCIPCNSGWPWIWDWPAYPYLTRTMIICTHHHTRLYFPYFIWKKKSDEIRKGFEGVTISSIGLALKFSDWQHYCLIGNHNDSWTTSVLELASRGTSLSPVRMMLVGIDLSA